jgi:hypothetical protein
MGAMLALVCAKLAWIRLPAKAPFVAIFVDVTGMTIYFPVATMTLKGTLL